MHRTQLSLPRAALAGAFLFVGFLGGGTASAHGPGGVSVGGGLLRRPHAPSSSSHPAPAPKHAPAPRRRPASST